MAAVRFECPAHFCGIAGLKPTPGRVPATGHFPEISHPGGLLGVAGPMARTVRGCRRSYLGLCRLRSFRPVLLARAIADAWKIGRLHWRDGAVPG